MPAEAVQNELSVRPEGRSPAIWLEYSLDGGVLRDQIKQRSAYDQHQESRIQQNGNGVLLRGIELIKLISCLQFSKQRFHLSAIAIDRR